MSLELDDMTVTTTAIEADLTGADLTEATDAHHRHITRETIVQTAEAMTVRARDLTRLVSSHPSSLTSGISFTNAFVC